MRKHAYQCRNNILLYIFQTSEVRKIVIVPKTGLEEQNAGLIESRR